MDDVAIGYILLLQSLGTYIEVFLVVFGDHKQDLAVFGRSQDTCHGKGQKIQILPQMEGIHIALESGRLRILEPVGGRIA